MVTGKWAPAGIGAVHTGRQPDNQQAGIIVAKWRYRAGMIIGMLQGNLVQETGKSGTVSAIRVKFRRVLPRHSVLQRGHYSG